MIYSLILGFIWFHAQGRWNHLFCNKYNVKTCLNHTAERQGTQSLQAHKKFQLKGKSTHLHMVDLENFYSLRENFLPPIVVPRVLILKSQSLFSRQSISPKCPRFIDNVFASIWLVATLSSVIFLLSNFGRKGEWSKIRVQVVWMRLPSPIL